MRQKRRKRFDHTLHVNRPHMDGFAEIGCALACVLQAAEREDHSLVAAPALSAMRTCFGDEASSGRRTLKIKKGKLPADADLVVTLRHRGGIVFYRSDKRRWVVSYPQQHHQWGSKKDRATSQRFKRTVRVFKAARNGLVATKVLTKDDAPSYSIECLAYNAPDALFKPKLAPTYTGVLGWLKTAKLDGFLCQNRKVVLFGPGKEQWTQKRARAFVKALQGLWNAGG